ncbi:EAL domain-containing protein [Pseudoalteromonas tunicata]|nr:EAL domain-containing protein [Pseudoalteromonas tunicata]
MISPIRSLQSKILFLFVSLLIAVLLLAMSTVLSQNYQHSRQQLEQRMATSAKVVRFKLVADADVLLRSLTTLAKDFSVKQLIASGEQDPDSLESALLNHKRRLKSDFALVLNADQQIIAGTTELSQQVVFDFDLTPFSDHDIRLMAFSDGYYLIKVAPVKYVESTNAANAWLVMGININHLIDQSLAELSGFNVSLLVSPSQPEFIASTLVLNDFQLLAQSGHIFGASMHEIDLAEHALVAGVFPLGFVNQTQLFVLLSTDKKKAFLSFNALIVQLMGIIVLSVIVAFLAAFFVSKGVTKPLRSLAKIAENIRLGNYVNDIPHSSTIEVESLSQALNTMQHSIQEREAQINQLAYFDTLTKLPNRNQFYSTLESRLHEHKKRAASLAILQLDLDRFKEVNDTLGHEFGDNLLKTLAQRLKTFVYPQVFLAHFTADEFGLILPDIDPLQLESILQQFEKLFSLAFVVDDIALDIDASVGVAVYPQDAENAAKLLQCSDIAMHTCKDKHVHYLCYQPSLNKHSLLRLSLMSELRAAILDNQLELFYQPKLDIEQQKIVSVECLVRWHHPEHGFIQPDEFIPLAEQSGHIRALTEWAIKTALAQHKSWLKQGIELQMAVNISAVDLIDLKLPALVAQLMSSHGLSPHSLKLEVTESAVMAEPDQALQALCMLNQMGIKLSIDDFGTGFSSMAQLKKMPLDELKIDKSFVLDLNNDEDDEVIVKSTVELAHNLGLSVVAEGVEDLLTLNKLKGFGCDIAQGYFIAKPMTAENFIAWWDPVRLQQLISHGALHD